MYSVKNFHQETRRVKKQVQCDVQETSAFVLLSGIVDFQIVFQKAFCI